MSSSSSLAGDVGGEFMRLVDLYLIDNPTDAIALAPISVRFAAAKVLIHKSGLGSQERVNWPGDSASRLAAILLVLYWEALTRSFDVILGLDQRELYDLITEILQKKDVSRESMLLALGEVDLDGTTTELVKTGQMNALWRTAQSRSAYAALTHSSAVAREQHVSRMRTKSIKSGVGRAIAYGRFAIAMVLGGIVTLGDARGWWADSQGNLRLLHLIGRPVLNGSVVLVGATMIIAVFPDRLDTKGAVRLLMAVLVVGGGQATFNLFLSYWTRHTMYSEDNLELTRLHQVFVVFVCLNNLVHWYPLVRRRFTYDKLTSYLLSDSTIYLSAALLFRFLGPPNFYPPGRVHFVGACCRALNSLVVAAMCHKPIREAIVEYLNEDPKGSEGTGPHGEAPRGIFNSLRDKLEPKEYPVAESAHVDDLQNSITSESVRSVVRRRLASRLMMVRVIIMLFTILWLFLAEYVQVWKRYGVIYGRAVFASFSLSLVLFIVASSFPSDLTSKSGGRGFVMPACNVAAVAAVVSGLTNYRRISSEPSASEGTKRFYAVLIPVLVGIWLVNGYLCVRGTYSWKVFRIIIACEAITTLSSTFVLRFLLGECNLLQSLSTDVCDVSESFWASILRGSCPLFFSLILTSDVRQRMAFWVNGVGFNHVTLSLDHLGEQACARKQPHHISEVSSCGTDSDTHTHASMRSYGVVTNTESVEQLRKTLPRPLHEEAVNTQRGRGSSSDESTAQGSGLTQRVPYSIDELVEDADRRR